MQIPPTSTPNNDNIKQGKQPNKARNKNQIKIGPKTEGEEREEARLTGMGGKTRKIKQSRNQDGRRRRKENQ